MAPISDDVPKAKLYFSLVTDDESALDAAKRRLATDFSHVETESEVFSATLPPASETSVPAFDDQSGPLVGQWISTHLPAFLPEIVEIKRFSHKLEGMLAGGGQHRILIEPGYVTALKVVATKSADAPHRLFLNRGIYGEPVLGFVEEVAGGAPGVAPWPWTPGDYRTAHAKAFFLKVRSRYLDYRAMA